MAESQGMAARSPAAQRPGTAASDLDLDLAGELARTVELDRLVRLLRRRALVPQTVIAEATGASLRAVRNWEDGARARRIYDDRVRALAAAAGEISSTVTPRGISQWLVARNRLLDDRRPVEALAASDFDAVLRAARLFADGSYA